jgi:hypothetical protein
MTERKQKMRDLQDLFDRATTAAVQTGNPIRFLTTILSIDDALADPQIMDGAVEYVTTVQSLEDEPGARQMECFVCGQPWARERRIAGMVRIEFIDVRVESDYNEILAGFCADCATHEAVVAAVKRSFGGNELSIQPVPPAGRA